MKCVEVYKELYHQEPYGVAFCPYRISPLGAHIDHQYGKINGLAINKGIHMAYHPKQNGVVELQSLNFPKRAQFFVNAVPEEKEGDWADHLRGAAKMLSEKYRLKVGLSGIIEGSLPIGGLSSSASVIICFLSALCKVNGIHYESDSMAVKIGAGDYDPATDPCCMAGKVVCGIPASLFCMDFLSAGQCATGNGDSFVPHAAVARGGSTSNADRWICDFYDTAGGRQRGRASGTGGSNASAGMVHIK